MQDTTVATLVPQPCFRAVAKQPTTTAYILFLEALKCFSGTWCPEYKPIQLLSGQISKPLHASFFLTFSRFILQPLIHQGITA